MITNMYDRPHAHRSTRPIHKEPKNLQPLLNGGFYKTIATNLGVKRGAADP